VAVVDDYDAAITEGWMGYNAPIEWSNVTAALDWLAGREPADDEAARLLLAYARNWRNVVFNNHDPRRMDWLEAARVAAERVGGSWEQANVRKAMGDLQQFRKEMDAALDSYQAALRLYRAVGARRGEANVLAAQGQLALTDGDQGAADQLLGQAIAIYEAIGDRYSVPASIGNYGWALQRVERYADARPYFLRAAELFAAIGFNDYAEQRRDAANDPSDE
jgi:tetratricopeptide (TPR) repeat protein